MNECCEGRIDTPYCPQCGSNLKRRSLLGLVEDLERRLEKACETRKKWAGTATEKGDDVAATKVRRALARAEETIHRLACWLDLLKAKIKS